MKAEFLYVIISCHAECWPVDGHSTEKIVLPDLFAQGWRPIRETPFPAKFEQSYILICLQREPDGPMGFGFGG